MYLSIAALVAGFYLLIKGADWVVDGASNIAQRMGISELVIGLTVVSFGTSAPELIVNIIASFQGSSDIAIGNIVGSNISNTMLILGASAMAAPLAVQRSTVLKEIPFGLLAAVALFVMANDKGIDAYAHSELSRGDGIIFLCFFIIFMYYTFGIAKNGVHDENGEHEKPTQSWWVAWLLLLIGLIGLALGGNLVVESARTIARSFGISEALIGLTIVAVGTSLPELAASMAAARKGKADIAVGNIVGSNIFNIFWILGVSAIIRPLPFSEKMNFDMSIVVFSTVLLFFLIHNGMIHRRLFLWWKQQKNYILNRFEGAILVMSYIAYVVFISWRG